MNSFGPSIGSIPHQKTHAAGAPPKTLGGCLSCVADPQPLLQDTVCCLHRIKNSCLLTSFCGAATEGAFGIHQVQPPGSRQH